MTDTVRLISSMLWVFSISIFSNLSISTGRGSSVKLGLGMGMGEHLIVGLALGSVVKIEMAFGMDTDGIVNIFSSYCLDIFS